jgi:hypothetical protein
MPLPGFTSEQALYRPVRSYRTGSSHGSISTRRLVPQQDYPETECCRFCAQSNLCCWEDAAYCYCVPCTGASAMSRVMLRAY